MRLLLISQDFPPRLGGIETYCRELAQRLAPRCERFAVVAPRTPGSVEFDQTVDYPVHRIWCTPNTLAVYMRPMLKRLLREGDFDAVLHAQWQTARVTLDARERGWVKRVFIAAHGRELLFRPYVSMPSLDRVFLQKRTAILREADALFPVSQYTAGLLVRAGAREAQIQVMPNGVDPTRFMKQSVSDLRGRLRLGDCPVVFTAARLVGRKGVDVVLEAWPRVLEAVPDALYLIAGDGPERERLVEQAKRLDLNGQARFLGLVPYEDIPAYYGLCNVFVLTPREAEPDVEGFGLVYLEANAAGKPVVATRSGGIPDAVCDGETGLLVAEDDVQGVAEALIRLLRNPGLSERLAVQGRQRVLNSMTWDHAVSRLHKALSPPAGAETEGVRSPPASSTPRIEDDREGGRGQVARWRT